MFGSVVSNGMMSEHMAIQLIGHELLKLEVFSSTRAMVERVHEEESSWPPMLYR